MICRIVVFCLHFFDSWNCRRQGNNINKKWGIIVSPQYFLISRYKKATRFTFFTFCFYSTKKSWKCDGCKFINKSREPKKVGGLLCIIGKFLPKFLSKLGSSSKVLDYSLKTKIPLQALKIIWKYLHDVLWFFFWVFRNCTQRQKMHCIAMDYAQEGVYDSALKKDLRGISNHLNAFPFWEIFFCTWKDPLTTTRYLKAWAD